MNSIHITRPRRLLGIAIFACLAADALAFRIVGNRVTAVPITTAVARFRAQTAADGATAAVTPAGGQAPTPASAAVVAIRPAVPVHPALASNQGRRTASTPGAATKAAANTVTPAPGVYVYATTGYEKVDVLGGSRHDYPAQTTMTVTTNACGNDVRWDGLQQRWDQWTTCASGHAIDLRGFVTYHNFYGQVLKQAYTCDAGTQFRPETTTPGATFPGRCSSGGATAAIVGTVMGIEPVNVAGADVPSLRIRLDEKLTGDTRGTRTSDSWFALSDGLLLQRTSLTDADTQATFGSTHYHEELSVTATSLTPQR